MLYRVLSILSHARETCVHEIGAGLLDWKMCTQFFLACLYLLGSVEILSTMYNHDEVCEAAVRWLTRYALLQVIPYPTTLVCSQASAKILPHRSMRLAQVGCGQTLAGGCSSTFPMHLPTLMFFFAQVMHIPGYLLRAKWYILFIFVYTCIPHIVTSPHTLSLSLSYSSL